MGRQSQIRKLFIVLLLCVVSPITLAAKKKKTTKVKSKDPIYCQVMENSRSLYHASAEALADLVRWRTKMLTSAKSAEQCLQSCTEPSQEMIAFCNGLSQCQKQCTTNKIIESQNCKKSSECVQMGCSPMPNRESYAEFTKRDEVVRSKIFVKIANQIVEEFIDKDLDSMDRDPADVYFSSLHFAQKFLMTNPSTKNSYAQYLPQTMRCINRLENKVLEPIMQNNSYAGKQATCGHAFGLGQVAPETFYSNFGIYMPSTFSVQPLRNPCRDGLKEYTLGSLSKKCRGPDFQVQFYRIELFKKYAHLTPQQIHNLRSFDVELQIRLMFATIVNKIVQTRSWRKAFVSYGHRSYAKYTGQNSCVQQNLLKNLDQVGERTLSSE